MALDNGEGTNMVMPVSPMYGNVNSGYGGFNGCDGGLFWIIILFLFMFSGYGNGWGGFGGGNNGGVSNTVANDVQRGFDQSAIMSSLNGINTGVSNGFANADVSRCNLQANLTGQMNNIASNLQNCCCENRASVADLKYTVATENCADRYEAAQNTRDIIQNQNDGIQRIMDKLCQQELDALKAQNANLQTQINLANLAASQNQQTAQIMADNAAQTMALEQYLNPPARPAYIVANPNCCQGNFGYGCGCNG